MIGSTICLLVYMLLESTAVKVKMTDQSIKKLWAAETTSVVTNHNSKSKHNNGIVKSTAILLFLVFSRVCMDLFGYLMKCSIKMLNFPIYHLRQQIYHKSNYPLKAAMRLVRYIFELYGGWSNDGFDIVSNVTLERLLAEMYIAKPAFCNLGGSRLSKLTKL